MDMKMSFEDANAKLEATVKQMENKSLTLQESVKLYAQACELLAFCMNELDGCKGQIEDINEKIRKIREGETQ